MPSNHRAQLAAIHRFDQLIAYLRDEMDWPIGSADFEDLTFDYTAAELGIDSTVAAKIEEIKRLRPLTTTQPWGIFFVKFEPKRLPVVALRRILSQVALKKRAAANSDERAAWAADDLLFVSNYGEGDERQITFAHFSPAADKNDLPTLKVLGWDNSDTPLHLDAVADTLTHSLKWPDDEADVDRWRNDWRAAFTLRHREVITTSKLLSERLAVLARAIRDRIKTALSIETADGPLTKLMRAFQESLVHDLDAAGFADMYAQTISYGLLSARIANPSANTADQLPAQIPVTNPFLKELMETFLHVGGRRGTAGGPGIDFDELGVSEVVELLDDANMPAVVRDFGDKNPQEDPVIHFYELFLKEYDAKKRMQRGVFYTPRPVVSYIVRSVDELLRTEFGLADGLADRTTWGEMAARHADLVIPEGVPEDEAFVQILDPAVGTATFLVETIDVIYGTMVAKWKAQGHGRAQIEGLWNAYVPKDLLRRLYGYELMMAPYAIAHLKIGLKLYETGYRFESDERVRVYLTNALEPASDVGQLGLTGVMPALAHEAMAVNEVKRRVRFTVVMGNPPYANFGQLNKVPFILGLLDDYKQGLAEKKLNLDDDFIKFLRLAQHIISCSSVGIVGIITNNTFVDAPTRRGMRRSILREFDSVRIFDLHGNSIEREVSPDGSADENVFDIKQGVAISFLCRKRLLGQIQHAAVTHGDLHGLRSHKYAWLQSHSTASEQMSDVALSEPLLRFQPADDSGYAEYQAYESISEIFTLRGSGVSTDRDGLCFDFDRDKLSSRMRMAFDGRYGQEFARMYRIENSSSYDLTRRLEGGHYNDDSISRCLYRLFDSRWLYYQPGFTSRPAWDVMKHLVHPNLGLLAKRQARDGDYTWFFVTNSLVVNGLFSIDNKGREQVFPLYRYDDDLPLRHAGTKGMPLSNIHPAFCVRICRHLGITANAQWGLPDSLTPEDILRYAYAIFHSPTYRMRYSGLLKIDYPRVPLPNSIDVLRDLAQLGGELVGLHLMESFRPDKFTCTYTGPKNPAVVRVEWRSDTVLLNSIEAVNGSSPSATTGFHNVSESVWNFHIGGYQVCAKWLKDRKGRTLSDEDIIHYQKIVVAISETIRLMAEIDEVIEAHGGWPGAFAVGDRAVEEGAVTPAVRTSAVKPPAARPEPLPLFSDVNDEPTVKAAEPPEDSVPYGTTTAGAGATVAASDRAAGGTDGTQRSIEDYDRAELKAHFMAALPDGQWVEREEAIRAFARRLGFQRTGALIGKAGRSVINGLLREKRLEAEGSRVRRAT